MACTGCSSAKTPGGCKNKGFCATGCNKFSAFDWLAHVPLPDQNNHNEYVEVQFKNSRKEFFRNSDKISLKTSDVVIVQRPNGHDVGVVTMTGALVKIQMDKKQVSESTEKLPKIYRLATEKDLETLKKLREKEPQMQKQSAQKALSMGLGMKISDVEFQGDGTKATFFYTAEERIDFRELIKDLASRFGVRVEMKQIGFRQEAALLGGLGICGRELCCSSWLSNFEAVNMSAVKYQDLSLNPQKLSGQCGKLKCCLNYELDTYADALKNFPKKGSSLITEKDKAICQKIDIFGKVAYYSYRSESTTLIKLSLDDVNEIIRKNKAGVPVGSLEEYSIENTAEKSKPDFKDIVGDNNINRFDTNKKMGKGRKKRQNKKNTPSNDAKAG